MGTSDDKESTSKDSASAEELGVLEAEQRATSSRSGNMPMFREVPPRPSEKGRNFVLKILLFVFFVPGVIFGVFFAIRYLVHLSR